MVGRVIALFQRVAECAHRRVGAQQVRAGNIDDVPVLVLQPGGIRERLAHVQTLLLFLHVCRHVDGVKKLRGAEQIGSFRTYVARFQTVVPGQLEAQSEIPLLHIRNRHVLVQVVDRVDVRPVCELAIAGDCEVHLWKYERIILQHHSPAIGRAVGGDLLGLRAEVRNGNTEQPVGGLMHDGVTAPERCEPHDRLG